jgi:hypothetical protein
MNQLSPMNQLSLNVVAVGVFAMTFSVLLAPLLRIPEEWPAGIIFVILTTTTLDAIAGKSQGATLFLDWFARFSPEYRDRVLHHEAGHFLVAHKLGFPITDYSLNAWEAFRKGNGGQGGVQFDATALETALQTGTLANQPLDHLCMAWMAGIAAEQMIYGNVEGGEADRFTLQQVLVQLKLPPSSIENKQRWAILQAQNLLKAHQPAYDSLLLALQERRSIAQCYEMIQSSAPSSTSSNIPTAGQSTAQA